MRCLIIAARHLAHPCRAGVPTQSPVTGAPAVPRSSAALDLDTGTLEIEATRVVVDGKTENAQHSLALDPSTLAVVKAHVEMLDQEPRGFGPDYHDHGVLFCWEDGKPPHPDTITRVPVRCSRVQSPRKLHVRRLLLAVIVGC